MRQQADDSRCVCQQMEFSAGVLRCVCQQMEFSTGVHSSTQGGDESTWRRQTQGANLRRQRARTECGGPERDSQTHLDLKVKEFRPRQGKVRLAGRIGPDEHSVEDQERRAYLIVASVLSGLNFVRVEAEVLGILQGLRIAKKNSSTCVYLGLAGSARARRLDVHTTAEGTKARQISFTTRAEFVRSLHLITVNGHIVELEEMIIRIRPKTRCQGGTREHGTDRITNVSMGTLDVPTLMGRVGSRRLDCVPGLSKQVKDFLAATKFSSKIHPNVFGIDRGSGTVGSKPFGEPLNGRSLGAKGSIVKYVTEMVTSE
jgi:hypothetical protein